MSLLIAYILLLLSAVLWIAWDAEIFGIFDVFGKSFHYVWFEYPKRWTCLFSHGLRLAALCVLIALNAILSFRFSIGSSAQLSGGMSFVVLLFMLAGSFAVIPWIYLAHRLRWQTRLRRTASQLFGLINRVIANGGSAQLLERADYNTDEPWKAWHPSREEWRQPCWSDIVPVAYFQNDSIRSAVFCVDWETFLGWKVSASLTEVNNDLPLHGPGDCSFRIRAVQRLRGCPDWSVIKVQLQSKLHCA